MFQSLIGKIKTHKCFIFGIVLAYSVSTPYRDDKNSISDTNGPFEALFQPLIGTIKTIVVLNRDKRLCSYVSTPYRDDKNENFFRKRFFYKYVFQPLIGTIKTRESVIGI